MKDKWKFRGWDAVGDKGWVYGDLVHNQKVTETGLEPRVMVGGYEVVPESVGLCTGLKDEKNEEVYEGDILQWGFRRYVCEFCEGSFVFRDLGDGKLILNAMVFHAHIVSNVYQNKELLEKED